MKPTENYDHGRLGDALIGSIRAAVRAADGCEVRIGAGLLVRRVDVALHRRLGRGIGREDDGDVVPRLLARRVDDRVSVVRPRDLVRRVAFARQVRATAFRRHDENVLGRFHDRAEPACTAAQSQTDAVR